MCKVAVARNVIVLFAISCGGSPAPAKQPAPELPPEPAPVAKQEPLPEPPPSPPPAPEPPPKKSVYESLRDTDGDIAGLAGFSITRKADPTHCGGIAIVTKRAKKIAKDDQPLADVFALEFPKGLSFDDKHKTASLQKFNAFLQKMSKVGAASREHYEKQMRSGDAVAKVAAAARMAQIFTRLASLMARAEIPKDVRTGELVDDKINAFCDALLEHAEPIQAMAEQAMSVCAEKKAMANGGWWDTVCVAP
jgi:hypothetical protein